MRLGKDIRLEIDPKRGIAVDDVIEMLKGLQNEKVIEVINTSVKNDLKKGTSIDPISKKNNYNPSPKVTGNIDLPQIRELNEIAALLRSMEPKNNTCKT